MSRDRRTTAFQFAEALAVRMLDIGFSEGQHLHAPCGGWIHTYFRTCTVFSQQLQDAQSYDTFACIDATDQICHPADIHMNTQQRTSPSTEIIFITLGM